MMLKFQGYLTLLLNLVTVCYTTSACNGNINRNGIKKLHHDRCAPGPIIGDAYGLSLLDCVENCLITKDCFSIQYSRAFLRCLKSSKKISTDVPKEVCRGEVSSAREHWTEGFPDACQSVDCPTGSRCKFDLYGNVSSCEMSGYLLWGDVKRPMKGKYLLLKFECIVDGIHGFDYSKDEIGIIRIKLSWLDIYRCETFT